MSRECDVVHDGVKCSLEAIWFRASPWKKQLVCDGHAAEFRAAPQGGVSRIPMVKLGDLQFTCDWPGESGDGTCGAVAEWFADHLDGYQRPLCGDHVRNGQATTWIRRHGALNPAFDPRKVPLKPPPQVPKLVGKKPITMADLGTQRLVERLTDKTDEYDARVDEQRQAAPSPTHVVSEAIPRPPTQVVGEAGDFRVVGSFSQCTCGEAVNAVSGPHPCPMHGTIKHAAASAPSMIPTTPIPPPDPPPHRVKKALFDLAAILLDEAKRKVERWR